VFEETRSAEYMSNHRNLRVLHVGKFYPPHMGGMETHLRTLCAGLKNSVDLKVIVANDTRWTEQSAVEGVDVTRLGTLLSLSSTPICPLIAQKIRETRADLVHIHLPNPWAVLGYLLSGHRGPLVVTWHSDVIRQRILGRAFEVFARRFIRRCQAIIATSNNYVQTSPTLSKHLARCIVIPFGISIEELWRRDLNAISRIRERYGPKIVLSAGRLVYYKGLEYLIRAMKLVNATLLIVGDGPLRHQLEQEAKANFVGDRVHFLGSVEDLIPFYHACDIFALPSIARSEAFGIVQLEAMACGKPVINTHIPSGVPFVSPDGETGITVPPRNTQQMANALNLLLQDSELRLKYGKAALDRVRAEFTVETMVRRTLQTYEEVAGDISGVSMKFGDNEPALASTG
jgi:glycosyltransferase involved in cell wall biosynthesis